MYKSLNIENQAPNIFIFLIILIAGIPYFNLLNNFYLSDDFGVFYAANRSTIQDIFRTGNALFRPLQYFVLYLQYPFFGTNPFPYHLTSLLWHIVASVILYFLLIKVSGEKSASFIATIIFSIHWTHVENIAWACLSVETLRIFILLVSLFSYMKYIERNDKFFYVSGVFLFIIAFFIMETSIILLFIITIYDFIFNNDKKDNRFKKSFFRLTPFYIAGLLCVLIRNWAVGSTGLGDGASGYQINLFNVKYFYNFISALVYLIVPLNIIDWISVNKVLVFFKGYTLLFLVLSLFLVGLIFIVIHLKRHYGNTEKLILYGLLWIMISIGFYSFFNITQRYLFIATIGYSVFITGALMKLYKSKLGHKKYFKHVILCIVLIYLGFQIDSNYKNQTYFEKGSEISKKVVTGLHKVTKDIPDNHMVFFINAPAILYSETGKISVDVFRFGYKSALKLLYGKSPIFVRNGLDWGDSQKVVTAKDVLKFERLIEKDPYWGKIIPEKENRHFVTFYDNDVLYIKNINSFDWSKTGWKYKLNDDGKISLVY